MQRGQLESCVPKSSILGLKILWDIKRFLSWNAVFAHAMAATPLNLEFLLPEVKLRQMDPLLFLFMAMVHGAMWCHPSTMWKTHPARKLWYSVPRASQISGVIGLELTFLPHRHVLLCL